MRLNVKTTIHEFYYPKNRKFKLQLFIFNSIVIQFGLSIDISAKNIELHFPMGFLRIGLEGVINILPKG